MSEAVQTPQRFGECLRAWRTRRRLSQFDLGLAAEVSARHICFLENGRSRPSRNMVLRLQDTLDLPLRDRNELLLAAGFAPHYAEHPLDGPELEEARRALRFILDAHQPYPAFVLDRNWRIVLWNAPQYQMLHDAGMDLESPEGISALDLVFQPGPVRESLVNWSEVASAVLRRLRKQLHRVGADDPLHAIYRNLMEQPGVEALEDAEESEGPLPILVPMKIRNEDSVCTWYSTLAVFGATGDVTLEELVIESFFPGDDLTREYVAAAAAAQ